MKVKEIFRINKKNIIDLFKYEKLIVPTFQRDFVWNEKIANSFIKSLLDVFEKYINKEENEIEDFFGNFLFEKKENNEVNIIDGQQRITVLFLFFRNIYDIYKELTDSINDELEKKEVEKYKKKLIDILFFIDEDIKNEKLYIENENYREKFESRKENKKLNYYKVNKFIKTEIKKIISDEIKNDKIFLVEKLIDFFLEDKKDYFSINLIEIFGIDFAIDIYEKMNSNQVQLSEWDLLKSLYVKYIQENKIDLNDSIINLDKNFFEKLNSIKNHNQKNCGIIGNSQNDKEFFEILEFFIKGNIDSKNKKYLKIRELYNNNSKRNINDDLNNFKDSLDSFWNYASENDDIKLYFLILSTFGLKTIRKYTLGSIIKFINDNDSMKKLDFIIKISKEIFRSIFLIVVISNKRANKYENIIKRIFSLIYDEFSKSSNTYSLEKEVLKEFEVINKDFEKNYKLLIENTDVLSNLLSVDESSLIMKFNIIFEIYRSFNFKKTETLNYLNSEKFSVYPFQNEFFLESDEKEAKTIFFLEIISNKFTSLKKDKKIEILDGNIRSLSKKDHFSFWVNDLKNIKKYIENKNSEILDDRKNNIIRETQKNLKEFKDKLI